MKVREFELGTTQFTIILDREIVTVSAKHGNCTATQKYKCDDESKAFELWQAWPLMTAPYPMIVG